MAREKKTAVSPYERKKWLEQLDSGVGITKIAKAAGRDIRIVKDHIDTAREEVQAANVRKEFLLKRLEFK